MSEKICGGKHVRSDSFAKEHIKFKRTFAIHPSDIFAQQRLLYVMFFLVFVKLWFVVCLLRLTCLSICLDLVERCCLLYRDLPSFTVILQPIKTLLTKHLTAQTIPATLQVGAKGGLSQRDMSRLYF